MQIANITQNITMTSREIAELTGKRHDNVMRDTRNMLLELYGDEGVLKFEDTIIDQQNGQEYAVYTLPKRETMILVSGYSITMRAKIIDRWQELEAGKKSELNAFEFFELQGRLLTAKDQIIDLQRQILLSMQEHKTQVRKKESSYLAVEKNTEKVFKKVVAELRTNGVMPSWRIVKALKMSKSEAAPYLKTMCDNGTIVVTSYKPISGKTRHSVMLA